MGGSSDQQQNSQQGNGAVLALLALMLWGGGGGGQALPQARRPRSVGNPSYVGEPPPEPPDLPVARHAGYRDVQGELKAHFSQGRTRPGDIVAWNREVPREVRVLADPNEWAAFQDLCAQFAQPAGVTAALGAGGQSAGFMPAGFMPALTADELAGLHGAMRGANDALRRLNGLGSGVRSPAGFERDVRIVEGRVRRSGSIPSAGSVASLPRSAFRIEVDEGMGAMARGLLA